MRISTCKPQRTKSELIPTSLRDIRQYWVPSPYHVICIFIYSAFFAYTRIIEPLQDMANIIQPEP